MILRSVTCDPDRTSKYRAAARLVQVNAAKRERARRREYLPPLLFSEPAWDILLELYSFELIERQVTQSEVLLRIEAPPSTSIRWMKVLEAEGLVTRKPDEIGVDVAIALTRKAALALTTYFESPSSAAAPLSEDEDASYGLRIVPRD